jgi:polar amino acid transport system permease protein
MPQMLEGLKVTLKLFVWTIILSLPLGLILSMGRVSRFKPLSWLINAYLWIFRGTPLMLQLFFVYFGLPVLTNNSIAWQSFTAAVVAFTLNYAAYFAEIFRGGIISVNKGQYEAAKALGFSSGQTMGYIIVPQMLRNVIPPVANEIIVLVKDTALASSISLIDLLKKSQQAISRDADVTAYFIAAAFYLVITLVLTLICSQIEKKLSISTK